MTPLVTQLAREKSFWFISSTVSNCFCLFPSVPSPLGEGAKTIAAKTDESMLTLP